MELEENTFHWRKYVDQEIEVRFVWKQGNKNHERGKVEKPRKSPVSIIPKVMFSKSTHLWLEEKSKFLLFFLDLLSQNLFGDKSN